MVTTAAEMRANARAIRARLVAPANAVIDRGINLRPYRELPPVTPPPVEDGLVEEKPVPKVVLIAPKVRTIDVLQLVASYYNVPMSAVEENRRTATMLRIREVCGWLAHVVLGRNYSEIARAMNIRSHKGLVYSMPRMWEKLKADPDLAFDVAELETQVAALAERIAAGLPEPQLSLAMARPMAIARVMKLAADFYKVPIESLLGESRLVPIVRARHVACYLARDLLHRSFPDIGRVVHRDHSTIVYVFHKLALSLPNDPDFAREVEQLRGQIINDKGEL